MKLCVPFTLTLAALAAASPVQPNDKEVVAPNAIGKRCFLWWLFCKPKPAPPPPCPHPNPCPTPCQKAKRADQEENLAQLFNFIDAANEDDVYQFIHFYKNADKSVVEDWWSGKTVDNQFAPSFPASRIHEIADSETST